MSTTTTAVNSPKKSGFFTNLICFGVLLFCASFFLDVYAITEDVDAGNDEMNAAVLADQKSVISSYCDKAMGHRSRVCLNMSTEGHHEFSRKLYSITNTPDVDLYRLNGMTKCYQLGKGENGMNWYAAQQCAVAV